MIHYALALEINELFVFLRSFYVVQFDGMRRKRIDGTVGRLLWQRARNLKVESQDHAHRISPERGLPTLSR